MIASITGTVLESSLSRAVVEVGGVGLEVQIGPDTAATLVLGAAVTLQTSLVVREDSLTLYGFSSGDQRSAFQLVQTASGIGPRLGMAIVSVLEPPRLRDAILRGDLATLTSVPGVGQKVAQKMVIELKDKVVSVLGVASGTLDVTGTQGAVWREQVSEGLVNLGYNVRDAEKACDLIAHLVDDNPEITVPALLKAALQTLAK